ncbi:uncharacterized protein LOC127707433 [Mytilus californianus]|uniref:uncharacterized protein LOC127707433 n=1 Tax=Mytilus californianus TaxID=6549 RepID=UPI00224823E0|nr:uncharacterized protein LOC127707433 [Mytilus californianus]
MSCGVLVLVTILTITFFIQLSLSTCDSPVCHEYINPRNVYIFNTVICASGIVSLVSYFILWKVNENNEEAVNIRQHKGKTDSLVKVFMWIFTFFTTLFSVISVLNGRAKKEKFNDLKSNGNITINCTYNSRYDESVFDYRIVQIIFCLLQSMFLQLTFNIRFYRCLLIKIVTFLIFWANASHFVLILVNAYVSSENDLKNSFDKCIRPYPGKIHWEIKDAYKLFARFCKPMEGEYSVLCMMQIFEVSSRKVRYYTSSDREKSDERITHEKPEKANDERNPLLSSHSTDNSEDYREKSPQSMLTREKPENTHKDGLVKICIQDDNLPKSTDDKHESKCESLDRKKTMEKMAFYRFTHITGVAVIFLFIPDCALSIYSLAHDGINKTCFNLTTCRSLKHEETIFFVYHIILHIVMFFIFMFCFYMLYGPKTYFERLEVWKIPSLNSSHFVISLSFLASLTFYCVILTAYSLFTQMTTITLLIVKNVLVVLQISIQIFLILKVNEFKKSKFSSSFPKVTMTHIFWVISVMNLGFWFTSNFMGMSNFTKLVLKEILGHKTEHALSHIIISFVCFFYFKSCAKFYELFRNQYDF